jgi:hypothetical protein
MRREKLFYINFWIEEDKKFIKINSEKMMTWRVWKTLKFNFFIYIKNYKFAKNLIKKNHANAPFAIQDCYSTYSCDTLIDSFTTVVLYKLTIALIYA